MTWQNALFVVAGVSLMALLEWAHHRYDKWQDQDVAKQIMFYIGAALVILAGLIVIIFALKM